MLGIKILFDLEELQKLLQPSKYKIRVGKPVQVITIIIYCRVVVNSIMMVHII